VKKLTLLSTLVAVAAAGSAHAACNYNGFYIGVGPSYNTLSSKYSMDFKFTSGIGTSADQYRLGAEGASAMPYIGYGQKVVNDYTYLGLEVNGNFGDLKSKIRVGDYAGNGFAGQLNRKTAWGVGMRLGLLAKDCLFYTRLGVEAGQFRFRYTDYTVISSNVYPTWIKTASKTKTAFAPAIGVETRVFHKRIALRGEVGVAMYSRWSNPVGHRPGLPALNDQTYIAKFRPRVTSLLLGAAYCF
jgi:hypothetical protein